MLKLHKVRWFSRQWRKITAIAENHGTTWTQRNTTGKSRDRCYRRQVHNT